MAGLALHFFGCFQALLNGQPLTGFGSEKIRALIAYLAIEDDRPHHRASLAVLLWPERPEHAARGNLRQTLHRLHEVLGNGRIIPPYLLVTPHEVQFNCRSDCWVDVHVFRRELRDCLRDPSLLEDLSSECLNSLQTANNLYRGELLAGITLRDCQEFDWWLLTRREEYHRQALEALDRLAVHYELRYDYQKTCQYAQRAIELEPWREFSHRQKMRALALRGEPVAARRQYETLCQILQRELASAPTSKTNRLHQQICAGSLVQNQTNPDDSPI